MEIHALLACGLLLYAVIQCSGNTNKRRHAQVITLKAGEMFLGVLDRGKRDCVVIGDAPGRAYKNITAKEGRLLKQVFEPAG